MVQSLLEVLTEVAVDPVKKAAFDDDPARYLEQYGYEDVEADDLSEAFSLVADTLPPDVAQAVASTAPAAPTPLDADDGSGGAPDTTINPDEDAFGGVDESFDTADTATLDGSADGGTDELDADAPDAGDGANGNGGYGTGEPALGDLADSSLDADTAGTHDTVAFGVGSDAAEGADDGDDGLIDHLGDDGGPFLDGDAEGFTLDEPDDAPDLDLDGDVGLDLGQAGADEAPVDDVDDGPADDSFDDIGSF